LVTRKGVSGTENKCDCNVTVEPSQSLLVDYQGMNSLLYPKRTEKLVSETLEKYGLRNAKISILDNGALLLVIKARLESAIEKALEENKS
jgi:citrate lyase subunit gamma (acyl carrier protein)